MNYINKRTFNIAKEFSAFPQGMKRIDSERSAESLREDYLIPLLREYDEVTLEMDGTLGFATNFLEEVFKVIAEKHPELVDKIKVVSKNKVILYIVERNLMYKGKKK